MCIAHSHWKMEYKINPRKFPSRPGKIYSGIALITLCTHVSLRFMRLIRVIAQLTTLIDSCLLQLENSFSWRYYKMEACLHGALHIDYKMEAVN